VAILLVMVGHIDLGWNTAAGSIGVTVFFTLSGFLITSLLVEERRDVGRVSLRDFYQRRVIRLLPALVLFLSAMGVMGVLTRQPTAPSDGDLLGALFYLGNLAIGMQGHDTTITHTWSLSIEEQFYLAWPVLLVLTMRYRRWRLIVGLVAVVGVLWAAVARLLLWNSGAGELRVHFGTDTRMDALLVGCLTALWLSGRPMHRSRPAAAGAVVAATACLVISPPTIENLVVLSVVPWAVALVLVLLTGEESGGWADTSWLGLVGRRSYGLYLWHYPLWGVANSIHGAWSVPAYLAAALLTAGVAHLSWRCVEEPLLRLRPAPRALSSSRAHRPPARHRGGAVRAGAR
jgi:peptidoglycan/LPS O-acetylase OafA/YrhL